VSAKESIRKGDFQYLIPVTDLKSCWKTNLTIAAEEWYRESGKQKGRKYFENYYQTKGNPWFQGFKFRRKSIVSTNRIRSGRHYCLKECFIRFNIINIKMYECGEAKQCKLFEKFRVHIVTHKTPARQRLGKHVLKVTLSTTEGRLKAGVVHC
jgi:hypothetical protein